MNVSSGVLARAKQGEKNAVDEVLTLVQPFVWDFVRTHIDGPDADDVAQEVMIDVWESFKRFRVDEKLEDWVAKIVWDKVNRYHERGWDGKLATNHEIPFTDCFGPEVDDDEIDAAIAERGIW